MVMAFNPESETVQQKFADELGIPVEEAKELLFRAQAAQGPVSAAGGTAVVPAIEPECMWCRYGKPMAAGIVVGLAAAHFGGGEYARYALYGAGAGAAYGWWFNADDFMKPATGSGGAVDG